MRSSRNVIGRTTDSDVVTEVNCLADPRGTKANPNVLNASDWLAYAHKEGMHLWGRRLTSVTGQNCNQTVESEHRFSTSKKESLCGKRLENNPRVPSASNQSPMKNAQRSSWRTATKCISRAGTIMISIVALRRTDARHMPTDQFVSCKTHNNPAPTWASRGLLIYLPLDHFHYLGAHAGSTLETALLA